MIVGFGNCHGRLQVARFLRERGFLLATAVHPRATVAAGQRQVGAGTYSFDFLNEVRNGTAAASWEWDLVLKGPTAPPPDGDGNTVPDAGSTIENSWVLRFADSGEWLVVSRQVKP